LICLGKALTGGFPLSACVGRSDVMDAAWPVSSGEAIHTSTFLGHPVGCAMALAQIGEIRRQQLVSRSAQLGDYLLRTLRAELSSERFELGIRGLGLMAGVEMRLPDGVPATLAAWQAIKEMLRAGFIMLPEGAHGNVLSFTPPLMITRAQLARTVAALARILK
jgi:4-aminobutyrate aminotransferase-like enzyme